MAREPIWTDKNVRDWADGFTWQERVSYLRLQIERTKGHIAVEQEHLRVFEDFLTEVMQSEGKQDDDTT